MLTKYLTRSKSHNMDNYNYPMGADTPEAPWNQVDPEPRTIEVTVSMTVSKTVKIDVDDYAVEKCEEDGNEYYDYSDCDLKGAVKEQITLPELKDWVVDDFEVVSEE
jgi:hypothetical protein